MDTKVLIQRIERLENNPELAVTWMDVRRSCECNAKCQDD